MATTAGDTPSVSAEEALARRKKQARREAKLMLAIEQAKRDLTKAQQQQVKAQLRLEKQSTSLYTLEARLAELRASSPQTVTGETLQGATDERQQAHAEVEEGIVLNDENELVSPDHEHQGTLVSLTDQILASPHVEEGKGGVSVSAEAGRATATDAEPTPLMREEATLPESTVAIRDATGEDAMQEHETAVARAPASTTPRKKRAPTTAAVRTSTATKRPATRNQRSRKPSANIEHAE